MIIRPPQERFKIDHVTIQADDDEISGHGAYSVLLALYRSQSRLARPSKGQRAGLRPT